MSGSKVSSALMHMLTVKRGYSGNILNAEEVLMLEDSQPAGLYKQCFSLINLTSEPCPRLCTNYLISPLALLILTQAELKVLTDPFCFIGPSPALTTSRTVFIWNTLPVSLVSNSYVPHFGSHVWMHITH